MTRLVLTGCRATPLGGYLKALGVFRLVAAQVGPAATLAWDGDLAALDSDLDQDGLVGFLVERYRPTPVLSPWNSDAGFKETSSEATRRLLRVEQSDEARLAPYRAAIAAVRLVKADPRWGSWTKAQQVTSLRNALPDDAVEWLDATVVLRDGDPGFPPVLGSGGNFGRLELSPTFMDRVVRVLDASSKGREASRAWALASLFDVGAPALGKDPAGQFDPGAAGGVRSTGFGAGDPLTNPWDLVLQVEGSLVWASGVARRSTAGSTLAAVPFTVAPTAVGQASLSRGERAKAELWAPLWSAPAGMGEVRRLFAEGRMTWNGAQARSGLDAVRAMATLGADAGIGSFVRHVIADRLGQSPLAVAVGTMEVKDHPRVGVVGQLDRWVDRLRRAAAGKDAPQATVRAAAQVERAMFAASAGSPSGLQDLLIAVAAAEAQVGRTERARKEGGVPPVAWLDPGAWLPALDDGSPELRLAAALALARDDAVLHAGDGLVRFLLRPVSVPPNPVSPKAGDRYRRLAWTLAEARVRGTGSRPIADVLADVLVARASAPRSTAGRGGAVGADGFDTANGDGAGGDGAGAAEPWFPVIVDPGPGDVEAFAAGRRGTIDTDRLAELLPGLLLLAPRPSGLAHRWSVEGNAAPAVVPAWRVLAPFFSRHPVPLPGRPVRLHPRPDWPRRLVAGDVEAVLDDALLRLRMARLTPRYRSVGRLHKGVDCRALAASLLFGASRADLRRALRSVVTDLDVDPSASSSSVPNA